MAVRIRKKSCLVSSIINYLFATEWTLLFLCMAPCLQTNTPWHRVRSCQDVRRARDECAVRSNVMRKGHHYRGSFCKYFYFYASGDLAFPETWHKLSCFALLHIFERLISTTISCLALARLIWLWLKQPAWSLHCVYMNAHPLHVCFLFHGPVALGSP